MQLAENFEWSEVEEERELESKEDVLFSLHHEFAEQEISRVLQQISFCMIHPCLIFE